MEIKETEAATEEKKEGEDMENEIDLTEYADELNDNDETSEGRATKGGEEVFVPDEEPADLTADLTAGKESAESAEESGESDDSAEPEDDVVMPTSGSTADNTNVEEAAVKADENMPEGRMPQQAVRNIRKSMDIQEVGVFDKYLYDANEEKTPEQLESERWIEVQRILRNDRAFIHSTLDKIRRDATSGKLRFFTHLDDFEVEISEGEFFGNDFRYLSAYYNNNLSVADQRTIDLQYRAQLKHETEESGEVSDDVKNRILKNTVDAYLERRRERIKENMAHDMEGAIITFAITYAKRRKLGEKEAAETGEEYIYTVVGSRIEGMRRAREYYFNPKSRNCVHENDTAVANILYANARYVLVECCGVDGAITAYELAEKPIDDPRSEFSPGDSLKVRIREIKKDEETGKITLRLSRRLYELNKHAAAINSLETGDVVLGIVKTGLTKRGNYSVILTNGVGCVINQGQVNDNIPLVPNDRVRITVLSVDRKSGFVRGRAKRIGHVRRTR